MKFSTCITYIHTIDEKIVSIFFNTLNNDFTRVFQELENERQKNERLESALAELRTEHEQILRVTEIMKKELEEQKKIEGELRDNLAVLKIEADTNKRERNVLAHQSTLILQGLSENSDGEDCMVLLEEIEELKRTVEDERNKHEEEISILQVLILVLTLLW